MVLLIIADDFTGALDTGVQFAARGIRTRVVVGANAKLTQQDTDVLVVDTETRHLPAAQAYAAVEGLVQRAKRAGFAYLYKRRIPLLRGNGRGAGSTAERQRQPPAGIFAGFPQMNRVTKNGVQYIDDIPVTESPLALTRLNRCAMQLSPTFWRSRPTCLPPASRH